MHRFVREPSVELYGVKAAGHGLDSGKHGASLARGQPGVLHGSRSYLLQTDDGQVSEAHSISAGLDYPGVGPELSHLRDQGRLKLLSATDDEALQAFQVLARSEGILCALSRRTRWRRCASCRRAISSSSISPAAATRTWERFSRR